MAVPKKKRSLVTRKNRLLSYKFFNYQLFKYCKRCHDVVIYNKFCLRCQLGRHKSIHIYNYRNRK